MDGRLVLRVSGNFAGETPLDFLNTALFDTVLDVFRVI